MQTKITGRQNFCLDLCSLCIAVQVVPPVARHAGGQGTGLLWWPQRLGREDLLTSVAADATAALRRERASGAAVAFLCRLHAGATPQQAAQLPPAVVPPFTVLQSNTLLPALFAGQCVGLILESSGSVFLGAAVIPLCCLHADITPSTWRCCRRRLYCRLRRCASSLSGIPGIWATP